MKPAASFVKSEPSTSSPSGRGESPSVPTDEREKTIPFLRQLTKMLQNNQELISFVPGQRLPNGETVHGKIVVHDRHLVQAQVLPIYFNHSSFASFRRQLSYFSFVRVGKIRQSGAAYTNESVIELGDILRLKRRSGGQGGRTDARQPEQQLEQQQKQLLQEHHRDHQGRQFITTSAEDVASAVLSGTLHAAKTNHNLDRNNINSNSNSNNRGSGSDNTRTFCHTSSTVQSSISQSLSQSTSSSTFASDNASNNDKVVGSRNDTFVSDNASRGKGVCGVSHPEKTTICSKRKAPPPSMTKLIIPRRQRARVDRLLSINYIVPLIHLPKGHIIPRKEK